MEAIILAEEQITLAHRPTPRHGWTQAREATQDPHEPATGSAVLRVSRSKVDSTISLVGLDPTAVGDPCAPIATETPTRKPDVTRDYAEGGLEQSGQLAASAKTEAVAKPVMPTTRDKTLAGLPPVSRMFKQRLAKAPEGEPMDALPWKPSAPTPGVFKRNSVSPVKAVRETETARDLAMADLSFAETGTAIEDDRTLVDTVEELSLAGADATEDSRRETHARAAGHTDPRLPSTDRPPDHSSRRPMPIAAWLLVAACGVAAITWSALSSAITGAGLATMRPTWMDAPARQPTATTRSQPAPLPQVPGAAATGESFRSSAEPDTEAEGLGTSADEADEDEPEHDAAHTGPAVRSRELVSEGRALQKRRKYGQAEERYREALKVYPGYPRALKGLVRVAIAQGKGKQAITLAKQLQRARPGQVAYLVLLGDAYESAGKRKEARSTWQAAARKGSATARARLKR